jgi:hypothetical protein
MLSFQETLVNPKVVKLKSLGKLNEPTLLTRIVNSLHKSCPTRLDLGTDMRNIGHKKKYILNPLR